MTDDVQAPASESSARERAFLCLSHSPFMKLPGNEDFGPEYRRAVDVAKQFIADFDPDLVVMFAPDHMNLLNEVRPPFTGILSGSTLVEFGIPDLTLSVHPEAAELYERIVHAEVDLAVGEGVSVDHGMGLTLMQLFDDPESVPLVPIIVNAIGFPLFPVSRAATVGAAFGASLADYDGRVLFIGTGGLSHNPPFPAPAPGATRLDEEERQAAIASAMDFVDPTWDASLLKGMSSGSLHVLADLAQPEIDLRGGGANEIRTWTAAWAAAGATPATFTSYELVAAWITGMGVAFGRGEVVQPARVG